MHHGIYIMECIWLSFWILQKKVGISFYFWIFRLVNSQLALYSHVRCNPLDTPNTPETPPKHPHMTITNFNYEDSYEVGISFYFWIIRLVNTQHCTVMSDVTHLTSPGTPNHPQNTPHMTITNFNYEGLYLPGVLCHIVVKTDFGKSTPQMHHGIYIMVSIWQPFWIIQEMVGISFHFWIIRLVNSQLALYSHVTCNPLNTPNIPKNTPTWQLQISTMRAHMRRQFPFISE